MKSISFEKNEDFEKVRRLGLAIDFFNGASEKFVSQYQSLEMRVKELDMELKNKNEELEINLKEKEEAGSNLHNILESITTGVVVINLEGKITTFNRPAETITGLIAERVKGKDFDEIFGINFFQDLRLDFGFIAGVREDREIETEIRRKDKTTGNIRLSISPVRSPHEKKVGIVMTLQDITMVKKLEEQANRADRLTAMGEMAAKIAHEIRNPLGSIELFATTLFKELEDFEKLKEVAGHISSGVRSINNIISNLLLFIKPDQKADFKIIDIDNPIKDSLFFSSHLTESDNSIEVVTDYYSRPIMVNGDLELLKQVFLNLILNAIQAMPDGGRLTISTNIVKVLQGDTPFVEIIFADTGTGILEEDMPRIFDPFFTTRMRGTGLGLAIAHNIIKLHGGTIDIGGSDQKGTACTITLPLFSIK